MSVNNTIIGSDNAKQVTSHYLNQWWLVYWRIYASLGLNECMLVVIHALNLMLVQLTSADKREPQMLSLMSDYSECVDLLVQETKVGVFSVRWPFNSGCLIWHLGVISSGARPTNDISIKFKIWPKLAMLWFKIYHTDHNEILHTSRQLHCRDMCKISLGLVEHIIN